jgi:hypothetical protein
MNERLKAMRAALRVLGSLTENHQPNETDVAALEHFAGPRPPNVDLDEFACSVIHRAIKNQQ